MIVYKITNTANGKAYIGITVRRLSIRWGRHVADAREGCPTPLHRAILKYGTAAFRREPIYEAASREELLVVERGLIAAHATFAPNGYNVTLGGGGVPGWRVSEESKQRARERMKGYTPVCAGQPHTAEAKAAIRAALHARSAFSVETIGIIKALLRDGYPKRWIARRFGMDRGALRCVGLGRTWRLVPVADEIPPAILAEAAEAKRVVTARFDHPKDKSLPKQPVGRPKGALMSAEAKAKISDALRKRVRSPDSYRKCAETWRQKRLAGGVP